MLFGRRILDFVFARMGSGERFSLSVSCTANSSSISTSWIAEEVERGVGISAGGRGDDLNGSSRWRSSRKACILENRRGNWTSMGAISEEFKGVRLDIRLGRAGPSSGGGEAMNLGSISTIEGFDCRCSLNGESMGVLSADLRLDGLESSTGERGRVVLSAVGAGFLVPFHIDSCVLPGVVLMIDGTGGASVAELFIVEYLLLDEFGTLKFGVAGEWTRADLAGPPYVE